jgi:hypothetical protein
VTEVVAVEDMQAGVDSTVFTTTEVCARARPEQPLVWRGDRPVRIGKAIEDSGVDVGELLAAIGAGAGAGR